jgi:hypothetical protein
MRGKRNEDKRMGKHSDWRIGASAAHCAEAGQDDEANGCTGHHAASHIADRRAAPMAAAQRHPHCHARHGRMREGPSQTNEKRLAALSSIN